MNFTNTDLNEFCHIGKDIVISHENNYHQTRTVFI